MRFPMPECISAMETAFNLFARGEALQPLRTIFRPPKIQGVMALMPSFRSEAAMFGLKAICVFPGNAAIGKDAHQGGVMLFDGTTGELLAVVNASAITAIRTAAVSALATRLLAREDATELAIIGAGVQAQSHLTAIACVREIKRARIAATHIEPVKTAQEALQSADVIVTATTAREPVLRREWISAGAHINAIGTFSPKAREIDTATMVDATVFVDARESALNEAGDYLIAAAEGAIGPEHIRAELGEVLIGKHPGRISPDEITLFKSLGLAVEDLAAAAHVYQRAREQNAGTWIQF